MYAWSDVASELAALKREPTASVATLPTPSFASSVLRPSNIDSKTRLDPQTAFTCNEAQTARDFDHAWDNYQQRLVDNPVTGKVMGLWDFRCVGWPLPQQRWDFRMATSSLQLVGHLKEYVTPYENALAMQNRFGGALLTMDDDFHAHAEVSLCGAAKIVRYFTTGQYATDHCPNDIQIPKSAS